MFRCAGSSVSSDSSVDASEGCVDELMSNPTECIVCITHSLSDRVTGHEVGVTVSMVTCGPCDDPEYYTCEYLRGPDCKVCALRALGRLVYADTFGHTLSAEVGCHVDVAKATCKNNLSLSARGSAREYFRETYRCCGTADDFTNTSVSKCPVAEYSDSNDHKFSAVDNIGKCTVATGGGLVGSLRVHHSVATGYKAMTPE